MNEMTDADGGTVGEAQADPAAVETTSEATTEQDTGTEESGQADDTGEATEDKAKRTPWFQKRIDEVTRQKYDAQREADYWRGVAEGRGPTQQQPQMQQAGPPDRWEDPEGYDRWLINQAAQEFEQRSQMRQTFRSFEERANAAKQSHPDYDTVVGDPALTITPQMAQVIYESEAGPEVAYYLGTNREEAARISRLSPHLQAAALGRIEAAIVKPAPAQTRTAPPPPPKTLAGLSAGINKDPNDMSMGEYVEWMKTRG